MSETVESLSKMTIAFGAENRALHADLEATRAELEAARRVTREAVAALDALKKTPPPSSAPAAPPVPLPRTPSEFVALPIATRERIKAEHPGYFDSLLRLVPGVSVVDPLDGRNYSPGEAHAGTAPPDLRRAEETAARLAATVRRAFADEPKSHTFTNGRRPAPVDPASIGNTFVQPPPANRQKTAPSSARRN